MFGVNLYRVVWVIGSGEVVGCSTAATTNSACNQLRLLQLTQRQLQLMALCQTTAIQPHNNRKGNTKYAKIKILYRPPNTGHSNGNGEFICHAGPCEYA